MSGGSTIQFLDEHLVEFLEDLDEEELLEDTTILFLSDHGNHMHYSMEIWYNQQFFS